MLKPSWKGDPCGLTEMLVLRTGVQALCSSAGEDTLREDVRDTRKSDSMAVGSDLTDECNCPVCGGWSSSPLHHGKAWASAFRWEKAHHLISRNGGYPLLLLTATHSIAGAKAWWTCVLREGK